MVMALNLAHLKPYCLHWGDLSTNGQSFLMRSMEYASISIAYLCFNKKQPVSLSTLLVPLFGDKVKKTRNFFSNRCQSIFWLWHWLL